MASPTDTDVPWWSSWRTLLAAGLMVVVLVLALFLALRKSPEPSDGAVPGITGSPAPTGIAVSQPPPSSAGTDDDLVPRTTPPPVSWVVFQQVALPVSSSAGPRRIVGDVAAGFAHTPTGALLAVSQISVRYVLANDWKAVVAHSIAPGPGRDIWVVTRSKYGSFQLPAAGTFCQRAGYRFIDAVRDRVVIEIASRCPDGQLQATTRTVTWQENDWKLVLQPDGSSGPLDHIITSLDGYVPWSGI
jgi:hypothetical protein